MPKVTPIDDAGLEKMLAEDKDAMAKAIRVIFRARMMKFNLENIGGNCPVQAEGVIDDHPFYFRARGENWSVSIYAKGKAHEEPIWFHRQKYSDVAFDAGWMDESEAKGFMVGAFLSFRERNKRKNGKPKRGSK